MLVIIDIYYETHTILIAPVGTRGGIALVAVTHMYINNVALTL